VCFVLFASIISHGLNSSVAPRFHKELFFLWEQLMQTFNARRIATAVQSETEKQLCVVLHHMVMFKTLRSVVKHEWLVSSIMPYLVGDIFDGGIPQVSEIYDFGNNEASAVNRNLGDGPGQRSEFRESDKWNLDLGECVALYLEFIARYQ